MPNNYQARKAVNLFKCMNNTDKMKASDTLKYCIHVSEQIQEEIKV